MPAKEIQNKNPLWSFFSSVRLTIVLLILLAVVSILGTIIPQREEAAELARNLNPDTFAFVVRLGLFDMYHALWFRILIGSLALNLVVCSLDRFRSTWKRFRSAPALDRERPFQNLSPGQSIVLPLGMDEASAAVANILRSRYRTVRKDETPKRQVLLAEKQRFAYFGAYVIHLSVIVILIGALIGSFLGFEAFVRIPEGETIDKVFFRNKVGTLPLGFEVRCDDFSVDFYENGAPREFRSDLAFLVGGRQVEKAILLVNHPVQFRGITFYQSSYEQIPGKIQLKIVRQGTPEETLETIVEIGQAVPLPGDEGVFRVAQVRAMGPFPAALVHVEPKQGEPLHFYVFQNDEVIKKSLPQEMLRSPKFNPAAFPPYVFSLGQVERRYATGLQVNRDPGTIVVWIGCALIVVGFFITFFTAHRRVWVRLTAEEGEVQVLLSGESHKNPVGLEREVRQLMRDLNKLSGEKRD